MRPSIRNYIALVEAADAQTIADVSAGLIRRFRVLEPDDFIPIAGRHTSAEAFADRLVDPASPEAAAARVVLERQWWQWEQDGTLEAARSGLHGLSGLQGHIAAAIGATAYQRAREPGWGSEMIFTPDGYILTTPKGRVFLDADVMHDRREIWLSEVSVEQRGAGLGSAVMEAIRGYAQAHGLGVVVHKVTNHDFFSRFRWLRRDGDMTYRT